MFKKNDEKATKNKKAKEPGLKAKKKKEPAASNPERKGRKVTEKLSLKYLSGLLFAKMMRGGATELRDNAEEVNKLNVFPVPDGDTGDNMSMTIESGVAALDNVESDNLSEVMEAASKGMLLGARGNSGVILSQFFAGLAKGLGDIKKADAHTVGKALIAGVEQAYASVMTPTEGTILTVAREAVEYAVGRMTNASTVHTLFADLVNEMHASVERTPELLPVLKNAGVVDSGAAGLFYIMDGINRVLNGEEMQKSPTRVEKKAENAVATFAAFGPDSVMEYGYCTELLLQLQRAKCDVDSFDVEELKSFLSGLGDSIVAFKTDSVVKLHVHTLTPERVLEYARRYGEFLTVKIENMSLEHSELEANEQNKDTSPPTASSPAERKKYGVVAVCIGEGLEALFRELGTDVVIQGGQTCNPSTNDFVEAFGRINAEHIFVFPNNSNIIMAAQQAAEMHKDADVRVIGAKTIGAGYVALSSMSFDFMETDELCECAEEAIRRTVSARISPAVRDADMNGVQVKCGDTIGIIDKDIVVSEKNSTEAAKKLFDLLLSDGDRFMLTVFAGKEASIEEREELQAYITESFPAVELYFIDGGQDIYPYIAVAE